LKILATNKKKREKLKRKMGKELLLTTEEIGKKRGDHASWRKGNRSSRMKLKATRE